MTTIFLKSAFLSIILTFSFSLIVGAQTKQFKTSSATKETAETIKVKREIIKHLLSDIFSGKKETIYLSTKNIPTEIQKDFPEIKDLTITLIDFESENLKEKCPYEFGFSIFSKKSAGASFGNCTNGLSYYFKKAKGKWQSSTMEIERE